MTDYVLVHGAWHGSWCWTRVRDLLTARGHRVFTPTLTGLGERMHLLSRDIDLDTHIADVDNLLIWEDLRSAVLVGHSYGGVIIRHVADRSPDRMRSLVYVDAIVPEDGKSFHDYLPEAAGRHRDWARVRGDGWKVPPPPASRFAVNAADEAWVDRQCTMHPLSTFEAPARLTGAGDNVATVGYVLACGLLRPNPLRQFYEMAAQRGWWREELPCGHEVMLDKPEALADLLLQRT